MSDSSARRAQQLYRQSKQRALSYEERMVLRAEGIVYFGEDEPAKPERPTWAIPERVPQHRGINR